MNRETQITLRRANARRAIKAFREAHIELMEAEEHAALLREAHIELLEAEEHAALLRAMSRHLHLNSLLIAMGERGASETETLLSIMRHDIEVSASEQRVALARSYVDGCLDYARHLVISIHANPKEDQVPMGHHINDQGEFQSDKHPELPPDRIRLNFNNERSHRALWFLAQDYEDHDSQLAQDIRSRLRALGYNGPVS